MTFKLKLIAAALAVGGAFAFGVWVTHNYYKAQLADAHEAATEQLVNTVKAERIKATRQVEEVAAQSRAHEASISILRSRIENLQGDIANVRLESSTATTSETGAVFSCPDPTRSPDFIRLWNAASAPDSGRTAPAETDSVELPQDPR